jgi:hypothetical protein
MGIQGKIGVSIPAGRLALVFTLLVLTTSHTGAGIGSD